MTPRVRRLFLVIAATACGSENPNVGYETVSTDSYQEVPGCGDGECSGQRCGEGECSGQGPVIELRDHRPDGTRADCDAGPIRSPGADIDSAELTKADGTSGIYLTSCTLSGNACESDNAAPANAEGASDAPAKEVLDLYTSLNGGTLSCFWAGGAVAESGDTITLVEVDDPTAGDDDHYTLRLCQANGRDCTREAVYGPGRSVLDVGSLL